MANELLYEEVSRLRRELDELGGKFIAMQRHYEDLLNNLDEDNFAANYKVQQGDKFSKIEQTADEIKSVVADLSDESRKKYSEFSQTAENITMEVAAIYNEPERLWGDMPGEKEDKNKLYAYYKVDANGDIENAGSKYKFECYYRYNSISKKWENTDSASIVSQFEQTVDGFRLNGDVEINGNTYQNGNIYVTGKGVDGGSAVYVCNGSSDEITGFISFDTTGSGENEAENRMLIAAEMGNALKILTYATSAGQSSENISIGAGMWRGPDATNEYSGFGYVYVSSPIVFTHFDVKNDNKYDVIFQDGCEVDFSDATVSGLYAVFA